MSYRTAILLLCWSLWLPSRAFCQFGSNTARRIVSSTAVPPATCSANPVDVYARTGGVGPGLYLCLSQNSWTGPLAIASGFPQFQTANLQSQGISFTDPTITQGGTPGSTTYFYCVVGTDTYSHIRSTCFNTALGNVTLTGSNFNKITVAAYSSTFPYILPVGSCDVYRILGGATQGKIGTIPSCAGGGFLNDTGLAGDGTTVPIDTSGVLTSSGGAWLGQTYIVSDEVGLQIAANVLPNTTTNLLLAPGYTHSVVMGFPFGGVALTNSGITSVGWDISGTGHACTASGYGTTCNADSSFAGAIGATVTGGSSIAIGQSSNASGGGAVVLGPGAVGSAGNVVAIGKTATAGHTTSVVRGFNAASTAANQFIAGGPNITEFYAGTATAGQGNQANVNGQSFTTSSFYSASGTPIPTCNAANKARMVAVCDNTAITPGAAYASGGTFTNWVQCTFNSSGSVFSWVNI